MNSCLTWSSDIGSMSLRSDEPMSALSAGELTGVSVLRD